MKERALLDELSDAKVSSYQRYLQIFVGHGSLWKLLQYEFLTGLMGPMPGGLGYALRARTYRWLLKELGKGSALGQGLVLRSPGKIRVGRQVMIDDRVTLDAKGSSNIEIGDQVLIGRSSILSCHDARIRIGSYVSVAPFCVFASKSHIDVGSNVSIGPGVHLLAGSHESSDPDMPIIRQARISQGITIGDGVWLGSGATVLDGVTVESNSIVGAGSVVAKDVPPNSLVLGNPARLIQKRNK